MLGVKTLIQHAAPAGKQFCSTAFVLDPAREPLRQLGGQYHVVPRQIMTGVIVCTNSRLKGRQDLTVMLPTCCIWATSGPVLADGMATAATVAGATTAFFDLEAMAAKSGLRMTPSLTPRTTDCRASSGGAGTSQPATSTFWKPCACSSACQLVRLMRGDPATKTLCLSLCTQECNKDYQSLACE